MKTKTKIYLTAISLLLGSIGGCCYNILSESKSPKESIQDGLEGTINAIELIKNNAEQSD